MCTELKKQVYKKFSVFMHNRSMKRKFLAFTISEILIVMTIIGVVAALTVPDLVNSAGNRANISRLKKVYSQLNEAQTRAVSVYGPVGEWFQSGFGGDCSKSYFDRVTEFVKIQNICRDAANNCASDEKVKYMSEEDTVSYNDNAYVPQAILADGAAIISLDFAYKYCNNNDAASGAVDYCGQIIVDTDGPHRGKNTLGIDIFPLAITNQGVLPADSADYLKSNLDKCVYYGSCSAWVLEKNNMDYTLVNHDKSGTYNCPNGNNLTWQSYSCD